MMKIFTALFTLLIVLAIPATSFATPTQLLEVSSSPSKAGTSKSPKPVTLKFRTGTGDTDPNVQPPTSSKTTIYFPVGARYNGDLFKSCSSSSISAEKSVDECPKESIIGSGKATGLAPGPTIQDDLTITAVNSGKNKISLFVDGKSPLRIQSNLVGTMSYPSKDYGVKLVVPIPINLQEPAPGVLVAITNFEVKIFKSKTIKGVKRGIIEINKCSKGKWKSKGVFNYSNYKTITATTTQKCSSQ